MSGIASAATTIRDDGDQREVVRVVAGRVAGGADRVPERLDRLLGGQPDATSRDRGGVDRHPRQPEHQEADHDPDGDPTGVAADQAADEPSDRRKQTRQHGAAEEEPGYADGVGAQSLLDLDGVDAGSSEHHVGGAPPDAVGLAPLVELADVRGEAVLVAADDPPGDELDDESDDGLQRSDRLRHRCAAHTVAIEHLQRPHRHAVGFGELVEEPERLDLGELADDVLLDLARSADLFEQRSLLLVRVGAQHAQRIDAVEEGRVVISGVRVVVERHRAPP